MTTNELLTYLLTPIGQVALIIGLAEVIKQLNIIPKKYIPVIDVILGIASGLIVYGYALKMGAINGVIIGLALGLSACGLFSGLKNVIKK